MAEETEDAKLPELTDQQQMFCEHYMMCWNGTKAATLAGYNPAGARQQASVLLTKPNIRAYVEAALAEASMGRHEVIARLTEQARADIRDVTNAEGAFDYAKAEENGAIALVSEIEQKEFGSKVKMVSSQQALSILARFHGLLTDRVEHDFSKLSDADLIARAKSVLGGTGAAGLDPSADAPD